MRKSYGTLILRLGLGVIFIAAGWMKVSGMEMTIGYFATMGFAAPLAYLVGYGEFIGGIALVLGVCTRSFASFLSIIMAVVLLKVKFGGPLLAADSSAIGFELVLFTSLIALAFIGSGKFSLDRLMWKKCCTGGSCGCSCKGGMCKGCNCKDGVCTCHADAMKCDGCDACKSGCTMHEESK